MLAVALFGLAITRFDFGLPLNVLLAIWGIAGAVSFGLLIMTKEAKGLFRFFKDAYYELLKVVWPTRQETLQTTLIVLLVVVVTGIFLWIMDSLLLTAVGIITGQKG